MPTYAYTAEKKPCDEGTAKKEARSKGGMINKHSWIDILWTCSKVTGTTRKISDLAKEETYSYQPFFYILL